MLNVITVTYYILSIRHLLGAQGTPTATRASSTASCKPVPSTMHTCRPAGPHLSRWLQPGCMQASLHVDDPGQLLDLVEQGVALADGVLVQLVLDVRPEATAAAAAGVSAALRLPSATSAAVKHNASCPHCNSAALPCSHTPNTPHPPLADNPASHLWLLPPLQQHREALQIP
jgi:hypothetical protein